MDSFEIMTKSMLISRISDKISRSNGILSLMSDLSDATSIHNPDLVRLGGGNPAHLPEAERIFFDALNEITKDPLRTASLLGDYSGPIGNKDIRSLTASYLSPLLGANLSAENVAFFNGSQNAFSYLLNAFSGTMQDGSFKQICLPIVPEYIGYADQTWEENVFLANIPKIESISQNRFRYRIDRKTCSFTNAGALLISRPTNPTGNVLSTDDLNFVYEKAREHDIPLLVDLAYGNPFPNLIGNADPVKYLPGMILSLSFSKVGLPGVRFGITIAEPTTIELLSAFGATGNLSSSNLGTELARIFWEQNTLVSLSNNILRPYYESKCQEALAILDETFQQKQINYQIHAPDGGFFLWISFPDLKISNQELYLLCKERNVYIVSGHYFFPGLSSDFSHKRNCIRLTYSRDKKEIARGAEIIAEIVAKTCA